jgi:hypothetical protein
VTTAAQLSGTLDSTKFYKISGVIDFTGTGFNIEVPAGGLTLSGGSYGTSQLLCTDNNYTLFTSPVGGSGKLLCDEVTKKITGTLSSVYGIKSVNGTSDFEMVRVEWQDCTSLGYIDNYRQGLEIGTRRFGGSPELELRGAWSSGYFIDISLVRILSAGFAGSLYKAGTGFVMQSRFRSNQNINLPASASFVDFVDTNFPNPSTLQFEGVQLTRNSVIDASDSNLTPNIAASNLSCKWNGNNGLENTFEGGRIDITAAQQTTIADGSTFYPITAANHDASSLQHFDNPSVLQLRNLGNQPRAYKVTSQFIIEGTANNVIAMRIAVWDSSASTFIFHTPMTRQILNTIGGNDIAFFNFNQNIILDQNDYYYFEVANNSGNDNVTMAVDSYFIAEQR